MVRSIVAGVFALAFLPATAPAQPRGALPVMSYPAQSYPGQSYPSQSYPEARQSGHQRPVYGYTLPRQWTQPSYYIGDIDSYDLPVPAAGFGWSRYYDDAVLTDRWGRVYDVRYGFEDARYRDDRRDGRGGHRRHRRHHDDDYASGYGGYGQPHWDMGYVDGGYVGGGQYGYGSGYGYASSGDDDCGCSETVTTTTRTVPATEPMRYETVRYETVREAAPRRIAMRPARGKYVRVR